MITELDNPFSVTKATEFSDNEINEYWVSINPDEVSSSESLLNPREYLPKYIIGGKGCGKTHILRYFSFPLQKIRHNNDILKLLETDKYIGLYSVLHGINSSKFSGKGIDDAQWKSVFEYYFELYICDNLLITIKDLIKLLNLENDDQQKLIIEILRLFNNYEDIKGIDSFDNLIIFLSQLRRKIDSQVLNAAFTRQLNYDEVKVLFSPGDLLFGIPNSISHAITSLTDIKFIYIFDEYEKLMEWQKKFVNTLIWDKKNPVTFWIGARRYGYTTRETLTGQEMKNGSEYQSVDLDFILRTNEDLYKKFAVRLYVNRLTKYYESRKLKLDDTEINENFCKRFEQYSDQKILDEIIFKNKKKDFKHIREFKKKIQNALKNFTTSKILNETVDSVVSSLINDTCNNPLEQKYKLFLFYKLWAKNSKADDFKHFVEFINKEYSNFKNSSESEFSEIVDKRKKDFIAQLAKENSIKNTEYSGINEFIKISQGNTRSLILLLKKSIEYAKVRGERPLEEGGQISLESQYLAVQDTSKWFYEDAELVGEVGKNTYASLKKLSDLFILERFCDKPVETTISCFYLKGDELSENTLLCLEVMKMHSFLIEDTDGRIEKNSGRKERMFQINKVLAPLWNLPVVIRGSLSLNNEMAESIFNSEFSSKFDQLYKQRKIQLNAPFTDKQNGTSKSVQLF